VPFRIKVEFLLGGFNELCVVRHSVLSTNSSKEMCLLASPQRMCEATLMFVVNSTDFQLTVQ